MKKFIFLVSLLGAVQQVSAMMPSSKKVAVVDLNKQLFDAVLKKDAVSVSLLLEQGADSSIQDEYGQTPLWWAVRFGDAASASLFLEQGIDANRRNNDGLTPILWAVKNKDADCVKLLLEKGADPNVKEVGRYTPLQLAVKNEDVKLLPFLLSYSVFFPEVSDDSIELFLTVRCMFNRFKGCYKLPKDIHYYILGKLPIEFLVALLRCKKYPHSLKVAFASKLAEYSIKQLEPIMVEVRKDIPAVFGPLSDELDNLLNPKLLEENIGEDLRKNCRKFLEGKGEK